MNLKRTFAFVSIFLLVVAPLGCGGGGEETTTEPPPSTEEATMVDDASLASLTVTVNFEGTAPEGEEVYTGANPECGVENVTKRSVHVNDDGTLRWVVVAVADGPAGLEKAAGEAVVIDQERCRYTPHVVTARTGQTVRVLNSDAGLHNVRATKNGTQIFNKTTLQDQSFETSFEEAGPVSLVCDVHSWMQAWIYVTKHGRAAVTDETGRATLEDLPPGDYTLNVWQEELGTTTQTVTLDEGEAGTLSVTLAGSGSS